MTPDKFKTVMAFGTFDILHDGHRYFLTEAKKIGRLLVVVGSDELVTKLKGRTPLRRQSARIQNLAALGLADEIISGDVNERTWSAIESKKPNIVAVGYDQTAFKTALEEHIQKNNLPIECVSIGPHSDPTLHSSKLRRQL